MEKIALLFPGQGSQYAKMGKNLTTKPAISAFEEASEILGKDMAEMCNNADLETLTKTENAQAAILTVSIAMYRSFVHEFGYTPAAVAGHSLGEYSALVAAGAIDFAGALRLVQKRAQCMQEAAESKEGAMLAVSGADIRLIESLCHELSTAESVIVPANYNSPGQLILSGEKKAVEKMVSKLNDLEIRNQLLKVSGPFHSPLMEPAAASFKEYLKDFTFKIPSVTVISNVTADIYKDEPEIKELLVKQIVSPVKWTGTIDRLTGRCITLAVELGPKSVLKNLMEGSNYLDCFAYDDINSKKLLEKRLLTKEKRAAFNIQNGINIFNKCMAVAVSSKNRNWNSDEYNEGVNKPYKLLKMMGDEYKEKEPGDDKLHEALHLLRTIMETKKVPVQEQRERFNQVIDETLIRDRVDNIKFQAVEK